MVPIRIIPRLEIKNGILIKGINFEGLRALGDPAKFVENYFNSGADEIAYIDVVASLYGTNNLEKFIKKSVQNIFIPITVGGGIRNIDSIEIFLNSGADKISINSAIVKNINFLKKSVRRFGSSTINCAIECIKFENRYYVSTENGRNITTINPLEWFKKIQDCEAGEVTISSINNEGLQNGFDLDLYDKISKFAKIPVIAHGGAGNFKHVYNVIKSSNISGVSISSLFHYDALNSLDFKITKKDAGNFNFLKNFKKKKYQNNLVNLKKYLKKKRLMSDYSNLKVGIINLKLNNIYSIHQLFKYLKSKVTIIDQSINLKKYDMIVLPGDGAFKEGMKKLKSSKLYDEIINFSKIKEKKVLGICLGMQLLFDKSSEFGFCKGLGLVNGKVTKLPKKSAFVPNIGWRKLKTSKNKIFNLFNKSYFYFSHSFYAVPKKSKIITSFINHGNKKICTSIQYENIFGIQFHPEKSHKDGINLIKKVLDYK